MSNPGGTSLINSELTAALWRKSSRSTNQGACVEIAVFARLAAVRDSKNPAGPILTFESTRWVGFLTAAKAGRFDPA
ncbi:DUF397 domain-containing protein [Gandjariella thermophila]|uniref:DUF397 domain-containing protein n=1 Tax=Gandjariella thermophila TaxID=1931992 RepID=A0A4D4J796_9PSEU|nr:DUF397 domain-containing protein [Gandjariella thermophila]GDY31374.1 DUF397 domain-containing protein [Gandjariella thermophila]